MKSALMCAVIKGPNVEEISNQLKQAEECADLVEWRLDLFDTLELEQLAPLKRACRLPALFTLRAARQGGQFKGTESARLQILERLLILDPAYVDLEADIPGEYTARIRKEYPNLQIIASHHDYAATPDDLESTIHEMKRSDADFYKLATMSHSTLDALRLLAIKKKHADNLITVGMGEQGIVTRILGPLYGCGLTYITLDAAQAVAPGQQQASDLELYRYHSLKQGTKLYGLIGGSNVSRSFGHITHNEVMGILGLDAVYVKMAIQENEIKDFISLIKELNIGGLSVTMPLKEVIIPYLDEVDEKVKAIGAINTILFEKGKTRGYNTDGIGALNALESRLPVKGKKLVLLGAGGASRAIAYEAKRRGADVWILNRHPEKAMALAKEFGCHAGDLTSSEVFEKGYDIIINATPSPMPIEPESLLAGAIVMDINNRPILTPFLAAAKDKGCEVVPGYEMFVEQAVFQFKIWFGDVVDGDVVKNIIRVKAEEVLETGYKTGPGPDSVDDALAELSL